LEVGDALFLVVFREYLFQFVSPNRRAILHKVHIELCINSYQLYVSLHYKSFFSSSFFLSSPSKTAYRSTRKNTAHCSYSHLFIYSAFRFGTGNVYRREINVKASGPCRMTKTSLIKTAPLCDVWLITHDRHTQHQSKLFITSAIYTEGAKKCIHILRKEETVLKLQYSIHTDNKR
jgi:hypothetical protein